MKKIVTILSILIGWYGLVNLTGSYVELKNKTNLPVLIGGFTGVHSYAWDQGYAAFAGTLQYSEKDALYPPMNRIEGVCLKHSGYCTVAIANVAKSGDDSVLSLTNDIFDIVKWDKDTLTIESKANCFKTVYTINRSSETVSGAEIFKEKSPDCVSKKNITFTMLDGVRVYQQLKAENQSYGLINLVFSLLTLIGSLVWCWRVARHKPTAA